MIGGEIGRQIYFRIFLYEFTVPPFFHCFLYFSFYLSLWYLPYIAIFFTHITIFLFFHYYVQPPDSADISPRDSYQISESIPGIFNHNTGIPGIFHNNTGIPGIFHHNIGNVTSSITPSTSRLLRPMSAQPRRKASFSNLAMIPEVSQNFFKLL